MSATPSVLYDAPGPRARRLSLVTSIVLGVLITAAVVWLIWRLGQPRVTVNGAVLTAFYMKEKGLPVQGFIVNHYTGSTMEKDNIRMIEKLSGKPVLAVVGDNAELLQADAQALIQLYQ